MAAKQLATPSADAPQMQVDVKGDRAGLQVHAELPGMKEDIHVHIDGPVVSISAERKQEKEIRTARRCCAPSATSARSRAASSSARRSTRAAASAKFNDGVLELNLPKKAEVQARRLTIE